MEPMGDLIETAIEEVRSYPNYECGEIPGEVLRGTACGEETSRKTEEEMEGRVGGGCGE